MHIRFNNSSRSENKIKQLPFFVCRTFDKHFGFISVSTSYLDSKIQYHENRTFLFCLSIYRGYPFFFSCENQIYNIECVENITARVKILMSSTHEMKSIWYLPKIVNFLF